MDTPAAVKINNVFRAPGDAASDFIRDNPEVFMFQGGIELDT